MKGAFYSGLYNSNSGSSIKPLCKTGNCTWSPYTSIGICSACEDISSLIHGIAPDTDDDSDGYSWFAPNGLNGDAKFDTLVADSGLPTIKFPHLQNYSIVDVSTMSLYPGVFTFDQRPNASECVLHLCVKAYTATVVNGSLTERLVSSFPNTSTPMDVALAAIHVPSVTRDSPLVPSGEANLTTKWPSGPVYYQSRVNRVNATISPPMDNQIYKIKAGTLLAIREWTQATLQGHILRISVSPKPLPDVAQVLLSTSTHKDGMMTLMDRIASSMTAEMRNLAGELAEGESQESKPFVEVRWSWLAPPAAVLGLSVIFVIMAMIQSMLKQVPVWRSNALPSLLFSLDENTSAAIAAGGAHLNRLEEEAKKYSMVFSRGEEMWGLEGTGVRARRRIS